MDLVETMTLGAEPADVFEVIEDLGRYPAWLSIVRRAQVSPSDGASDGHSEVAWQVDLQARLGPLSRAKRLRMIRAVHESDRHHVRFERRERDGRDHSQWVLDASVGAEAAGSELTMSLHYGGNLWVPMLDRLLRQEIERSRPRLAALLDD